MERARARGRAETGTPAYTYILALSEEVKEMIGVGLLHYRRMVTKCLSITCSTRDEDSVGKNYIDACLDRKQKSEKGRRMANGMTEQSVCHRVSEESVNGSKRKKMLVRIRHVDAVCQSMNETELVDSRLDLNI